MPDMKKLPTGALIWGFFARPNARLWKVCAEPCMYAPGYLVSLKPRWPRGQDKADMWIPISTMNALTKAAQDVLAERRRQIDVEGYDAEHDDDHGAASIPVAAAYYALHGVTGVGQVIWPWDEASCKPRGRRSNLVRAAALLLAELERMDRADAAPGYSDKEVSALNADAHEREVAALMAMTEDEIDAELRAMGIDPEIADKKAEQAIADAIATMRARGYVCRVCGKDAPHAHSPEEMVIFRNGMKRGARAESIKARLPEPEDERD